MTDELLKLKSVGPKTIGWLHEIGIHTLEDLQRVGLIEAFCQLKALYPHKVTLNALWGLAAALAGMDWRELPAEYKEELRQAVKERGCL